MKEYKQSRFIGDFFSSFLGIVYMELTVVPTFFVVFFQNNNIVEFLIYILSTFIMIALFTSISFISNLISEKRYRKYVKYVECVKYDGDCIVWQDQMMIADSVKKIVLDIGNRKRICSRKPSLTLIDQSGKEMHIPYPPLMLIINIKKIFKFANFSLYEWKKRLLLYPAIFLAIGAIYAWGLQFAEIENV